MSSQKTKFLIVDSDRNFAEQLKATLEQQGFEVTVVTQVKEVSLLVKTHHFSMILVECFLPNTPGVDLILQIRAHISKSLVFLMSGVYKDKDFIKEALTKTQAKEFFIKPFEIEAFISTIKGHNVPEENVVINTNTNLCDLFHSSALSPEERLAKISGLKSIPGFFLPVVIKWLSCGGVTGRLALIQEQKASAEGAQELPALEGEMLFSNGRMIGSKMSYQTEASLLEAFLVSQNLVETQDLERAAQSFDASSSKTFVQHLVDIHLLSPHRIDVLQKELIMVTILNLMQEVSYQISFVAQDVHSANEFVTFSDASERWAVHVSSKTNIEQIKSIYSSLNLDPMSVREGWNQNLEQIESDLAIPLSKMNFLESSGSISHFIEQAIKNGFDEEVAYRALHFMAISDKITWSAENSEETDEQKLRRAAEAMLSEMQNQNYFEKLGLNLQATPTEIESSFRQRSALFHPNRVKDKKEEIQKLCADIMAQLQESFDILMNSAKRADYEKNLRQTTETQVVACGESIKSAREALHLGKANEAKQILEKVKKSIAPTLEVTLLSLWAHLLTMPEEDVHELVNIDSELNNIPMSQRHNPLCYYVKALYLKKTGDIAQAKQNIKNALNLDGRFLIAKRELQALETVEKKQDGATNILHDDLGKVIKNLFNRKSA